MSFSCNGQYFDQKDGLFIGSPMSPVFAELYLYKELRKFMFIE